MHKILSTLLFFLTFSSSNFAQSDTDVVESKLIKNCNLCIERKNLKLITYPLNRIPRVNRLSSMRELKSEDLIVDFEGKVDPAQRYTGLDHFKHAWEQHGVKGGFCDSAVVMVSTAQLSYIGNESNGDFTIYSSHNSAGGAQPLVYPGYFGICDGELTSAVDFKSYRKRLMDITENLKSLSNIIDLQDKELQKLKELIGNINNN